MISRKHEDFFIQWDVVYKIENNLDLGIFNFWINDVCYPAKGMNITLLALFNDLTCNIKDIDGLKVDLGDIPISQIDFSDVYNEKFLLLDTGELFQFGFGLAIGFNRDDERVFYTTDFEDTYSEVILPKGTLNETLESLLEYLK